MAALSYDILVDIVPFLDTSTLVRYATVSHSLCVPSLRHLWRCPHFADTDQLRRFMHCLDTPLSHPYHHWITSLVIAFTTFQPIPFVSLFQSLLYDLPNLRTLTLSHTYALFSPVIQHYKIEHCMLEIPLHTRSNDQPIPWIDLYFINSSDPLPLTHLSIMHTSITGMLLTDDHLSAIVHCCPQLQKVNLAGLFSDQGIITLAGHCPNLQDLTLTLPISLVQSNTITHSAIDELAHSCPLLTHLVCLGQIRINPHLAEKTLRTHCKNFSYCVLG